MFVESEQNYVSFAWQWQYIITLDSKECGETSVKVQGESRLTLPREWFQSAELSRERPGPQPDLRHEEQSHYRSVCQNDSTVNSLTEIGSVQETHLSSPLLMLTSVAVGFMRDSSLWLIRPLDSGLRLVASTTKSDSLSRSSMFSQ